MSNECREYTLTIKVEGVGRVEVDDKPAPVSKHAPGMKAQIRALPNNKFLGWTGDIGDGLPIPFKINPTDVLMDSDKTITACFQEKPVPKPKKCESFVAFSDTCRFNCELELDHAGPHEQTGHNDSLKYIMMWMPNEKDTSSDSLLRA